MKTLYNKMGHGGRMKYAGGGRMSNRRLASMLAKYMMGGKMKYEHGGSHDDEELDPTRVVGQYKPTTVSQEAEFTETEGKQEATQEGMIGAINKDFDIKTQSLDELPQDQLDLIMASEFGKTYLSGEGTLDDQYRAYTAKVVDFLENNPEQALANINAMMETNDNFKTKLKGKSDQEKLDITRDMMTDGKIGDFHGKILSVETPDTLYLRGSGGASNIRGAEGAEIIYGVGNQAIGENFQGAYRDAMIEAGVDLSDPKAMERFFNQYIQDNPEALTDRQLGVQDRGLSQQNIERGKEATSATAQGQESGMNEGAQATKTKNELRVQLNKLIQQRGYNRNSQKYKELTPQIEALQEQINSMEHGGKMKVKKKSSVDKSTLMRMLDKGGRYKTKSKKGSVTVNDKDIKDMPGSTTSRTLFTKTTTDPSGNFSVTNPNLLGRLLKKKTSYGASF